MTLIDQRILIDAPQEIVWGFVANPDKIAQWHASYASMSVLTTQYMGVGARRRCVLSSGGKDIIEEITAAVNGIGYEYIIIEGSPYREFLARIRLQAGPDGTSVNWTIDYNPKGLGGILKNRLSGKRQMTNLMATSLRQLRHQVDAHGVRMDEDYRERVGMRDRLDFNERAQYQRRYDPPPGIDPIGEPEQSVDASEPPPPIAVDDSFENTQPVEVTSNDLPSDTATDVIPSFVADLIQDEGEADYSHKADTKPRPPAGLREAIAEQAEVPESDAQTAADQPAVDQEATPVPEPPAVAPPAPVHIMPPPIDQPVTIAPETPGEADSVIDRTPTPQATRPVSNARTVGEFAPVERPTHFPAQTPITDTGEISIWEVFGVERPSDTDTQTLEELAQTVREREQTARARKIAVHGLVYPGSAHTTRLRVRMRARELGMALGLRLQLALKAMRVRLRKPF